MREDFLLKSPLAQRLYKEVADLPIIDFHNHLDAKLLAEDKQFADLTELWVASDPYKHRAMRICGVPEKFITGDSSSAEKFAAWAGTLPKLIGNPLYDWAQMELFRVFGIGEALNSNNASKIFDAVNAKLKTPEYSAGAIFKRFNVQYASPCAGWLDDLSVYSQLDGIAPSLRGDDLLSLKTDFFQQLSALSKVEIRDLSSLRQALAVRMEVFAQAGCKFSDHALDDGFDYLPDDGKNEARFLAVLAGESLSAEDKLSLQSELLRIAGSEYARCKWVWQLHIGAARFTSSRLRQAVGPAGGFAAIGQGVNTRALTKLLDDVEQSIYDLPRTIIYTLNPADNAVMSILAGSYPGDGINGKVQAGPAWWWCDHIYGMRQALESQSSFAVLSEFVGMTTDSRSILSMVRHEYFRRVLVNYLAEKAARDEMPDDFEMLSGLAVKIAYKNIYNIINQ